MASTNDTDLRAVIHARQSKGDEHVDEQIRQCRERADRLALPVVDVFADRGVLASTNTPRPDYVRMMQFLHSGGADVIITRHADRLYRQPRELEDLIDAIEGIPVEVVQAGALDLATASGRMTARTLGAVSRQDVEMKSERQRDGRLGGRAEGEGAEGVPAAVRVAGRLHHRR